jgi:FkbM family methyltransferase
MTRPLLVRLGRQIRFLGLAQRAPDKFRIMLLNSLRLMPRMFGIRSTAYQTYVRWASRRLRGMVLVVEGMRYEIIDFDSLFILSEDFEPFMKYWFLPQAGQIVLDIGANIGKYTLRAAKAVGHTGRVIAVEPNPDTYQTLLRNIRVNTLDNVVALNVAAWNKECRLKLYRAEQAGLYSVKRNSHQGFDTVRARRMTDVLQTLGFDHADWVKIDVEGAEREVLEGMKEILPLCSNIIVEVNSVNIEWLKNVMRKFQRDLILISPKENGTAYFLLTRSIED